MMNALRSTFEIADKDSSDDAFLIGLAMKQRQQAGRDQRVTLLSTSSMQGSVEYEKSSLGGACFTVRFPLVGAA